MRKVFFVISLFGVSLANAQSSGTSITTMSSTSGTIVASVAPTNKNSPGNATSIGGWFEVNVSTSTGVQHLEVNYILEPKPFVTQVKLKMGTTNPMTLSGKIVDASGAIMTTWGPLNIGYMYNHTFDISSFAIGNYHLDIYDEWNNKVSTIPFEKTSN